MRKLLAVILAGIIATAFFANLKHFESPRSATSSDLATAFNYFFSEDVDGLWIDTIMSADGHTFGRIVDDSFGCGWYFDTIPVGYDYMLKFDSVGPSTLRLRLLPRELTVNLGTPFAAGKIMDFMSPIEGFKRFKRVYEESLDSAANVGNDSLACLGQFVFDADYADSLVNENAAVINRFVGDLTNVSVSESVSIPELTAIYAGFNPTKYYRPIYTGAADNISELAGFVAEKTFENWIRGGDLSAYCGSIVSELQIRAALMTAKYVTFSKYESERSALSHGMYTESYHTLDLESGKALSNEDFFMPNTLDKIKPLLYEVMAGDAHYNLWYEDVRTAEDVKEQIELWKTPTDLLDGTEGGESEREVVFKLPDGALTDSGIVFSFQPYEIGCWAAGAFHFIIPYKKLMPYLTPKAKRLINAGKEKWL